MYTRSEIALALPRYLKENYIQNEEILLKYQILSKLVDLEALKKKYLNNVYQYKIDNFNYSIKASDIISFLEKNNYDFTSICDSYQEIYGIPKNHFVYAVIEFLKNNDIMDNYVLPSNMNLNIKYILDYHVDVEAINKYLITEDTLHTKITLSDELVQAVFKDMPTNLDDLGKSIYIYIMLCKILSYDEEFHALNEEGEVILKHQDYHHVEEISPANNQVTCYEFNLIYAKFLDMLNIHFKSDYRGSIDESGYGTGHANLTYRTGKYLVLADSTERILEGDIASSKMNKALTGIRVLNKNVQTKEEFRKTFDYVYELIKKRENYPEETFDYLICEYQKKTDNYQEIDFNTKIDVFFSKIKNIKLVGVDAMAYLLHLKRIIFNYDEQRFNVKINIVADKRNATTKSLARLSVIIRFNQNDLDGDDTKYFLFTPGLELKEIMFDELNSLFKDNLLAYLEHDVNPIPNIERCNVK